MPRYKSYVHLQISTLCNFLHSQCVYFSCVGTLPSERLKIRAIFMHKLGPLQFELADFLSAVNRYLAVKSVY
jgi:hypothetical protein